MTPDFKIVANREDITEVLRSRLLDLRITDEAGIKSDKVEITLDDSDNLIAWPEHGAELEVFLGYKETGLSRMGLYVVDELSHHGPPDTLVIQGKAADMRSSIKAPKTRSWEGFTIGTLVATIAAEHQLTGRIADLFLSTEIDHVDQTEESDLHFLTRLARQYDAVSKPVDGFWVFVPKGQSKAASGQSLPQIDISKTNITQYRFSQTERDKYQSVTAHWDDKENAQRIAVIVGEGKPNFVMRHAYPTVAEAQRAADAKFSALARGVATLSLTLIGNTSVQAEGTLNILDLRNPIKSPWLIIRAEHQLSARGFITRVDTETPSN